MHSQYEKSVYHANAHIAVKGKKEREGEIRFAQWTDIPDELYFCWRHLMLSWDSKHLFILFPIIIVVAYRGKYYWRFALRHNDCEKLIFLFGQSGPKT